MKKVFVPKNTPVVVTFPKLMMHYIETNTTCDFIFDDKPEYKLVGSKRGSTLYECIAYIVVVDGVSFTFNKDHCSLR